MLQGKDPPKSQYRPDNRNIAPRKMGWAQTRGNTLTPPLSGPVSG